LIQINSTNFSSLQAKKLFSSNHVSNEVLSVVNPNLAMAYTHFFKLLKIQLLLLGIVFSSSNLKAQEMKIIYVYDALCGWCYGFAPVMQEFQENHKDELEFELVSGGMITGQRIGPIGEVAPYISWAYKDVEKATGVVFGEQFLNETLKKGTTILNSIPLGIALSVFKTLKPKESLKFASRLQKAVYFDGIAPENIEVYSKLAAEFGLDGQDFIKKMSEQKFIDLANLDFEKSEKLGVNGFPTVFLEYKGSLQVLARGYAPFQTLEKNYLLAKTKFN